VTAARVLAVATLLSGGACIDFSKLTQDFGKDGGGSDGGCPSFAFFCEDFEGGDLAPAWRPDSNPTSFISLNVESGVAHSGTHALRGVVVPPDAGAGPGGGNTITHFYLPVTQGRLAVRAWLMTSARSGEYASWLWVSPDAGPLLGYIWGTGSNSPPAEGWIATREPLDSGSDHVSQVPQQTNVWQCVELVIDMPDGGSSGHVELFVDGNSVLSFHDATLDAATAFYGALTLGVVRANDDVPETRFIDDVVLATRQIGCN
jgi:hypothetical protein